MSSCYYILDTPAGTHLNLCATLSQLGRHQPALEHAQCALDLLKQSLSRKGTGAQFTCFTSTRVQILTQQQQAAAGGGRARKRPSSRSRTTTWRSSR